MRIVGTPIAVPPAAAIVIVCRPFDGSRWICERFSDPRIAGTAARASA